MYAYANEGLFGSTQSYLGNRTLTEYKLFLSTLNSNEPVVNHWLDHKAKTMSAVSKICSLAFLLLFKADNIWWYFLMKQLPSELAKLPGSHPFVL